MRKREFLLLLAAVCAVGILFGSLYERDAIATGSWGLSFQTQGQTPVGPAGASELARYGSAYAGDGSEKVLYLTFDAGYENGYTAQILDVLKKHQVPAAFFLVGDYLEQHPDLVRRMVREGHTVGNHTATHPDMRKLTDPAAFAAELSGVEELYRQITGQELPKFYRPPQGLYSKENLEAAHSLGYRTVFWSLAYVDWNNDSQPSADYAFSKLLPRTHNGAVVLLHSTSETNARILDELLTRWKEQGYRFGTLEELFSQLPEA